jgi:hypothetical protein
MKRSVPRLLAAVAAIALAGCASYRLGSTVPPALRTVSVPVFENASGQPEAETIATRAVLREFRRDGTMRIAAVEDAALKVVGRVTACSVTPLRFDRDQPHLALEYRLRLTADVKVVETATGKVLANLGPVSGESAFRTQADEASSKRDALPRAAHALAQAVVSGTVGAW